MPRSLFRGFSSTGGGGRAQALPLVVPVKALRAILAAAAALAVLALGAWGGGAFSAARAEAGGPDRKSTRLNSSHLVISYAVFCLKKKPTPTDPADDAQAIN